MKSKSSEVVAEDLFQIFDRVKWNIFPFFVSLVIYGFFCVPMEHQTLFGMVLKCLPIITLQCFTLQNGMSLSESEHSYQRKIFLGLIFACIGDAFLDFPGYFLHGTIAFGVAQIFNISAFGFKPLNLTLGLKILGILSLPLLVILPKLNQEDPKLLIAITLYTPLLKVMIWRGISRATFQNNNTLDWSKTFGALGAISFGLSDMTLALNRYWTSIPYAQAIIMFTYYMAQFGIALTVIRSERKRNKSK